MIPRLGPYLGMAELVRVLLPVLDGDRVGAFETAFGRTLEAGHAIAFPYGRSALWAFFKAVGIEHAEIIQPAYSCSVVAHATVLAGNTPRFVDISLADYNMNLSQVEAAMSPRTRAVVATHLFGYPLDVDRLSDVVAAAERRYGGKIWVVQDCAHAFGAQWRGEPVFRRADVALFGLNVSKMMTSIFGGMLSTTDAALAARVRSWRDQHFRRPRVSKSLRRRVYLLGAMAAFDRRTCGVVDWCERRTSWLDSVTRAYHRDGQIRFPPDYLDEMLPIEATVGLEQLRKYLGYRLPSQGARLRLRPGSRTQARRGTAASDRRRHLLPLRRARARPRARDGRHAPARRAGRTSDRLLRPRTGGVP